MDSFDDAAFADIDKFDSSQYTTLETPKGKAQSLAPSSAESLGYDPSQNHPRQYTTPDENGKSKRIWNIDDFAIDEAEEDVAEEAEEDEHEEIEEEVAEEVD